MQEYKDNINDHPEFLKVSDSVAENDATIKEMLDNIHIK